MEPEPTVLDSLRKAVEAMPDDVPLRLHLATMLLRAGQRDEAVRQLGAVLQRDPGNGQALGLLRDPGPERAGPPAPPSGLRLGHTRDGTALRSGGPRIERMQTTTLGRGGPVVSRAGLGLMGMSALDSERGRR